MNYRLQGQLKSSIHPGAENGIQLLECSNRHGILVLSQRSEAILQPVINLRLLQVSASVKGRGTATEIARDSMCPSNRNTTEEGGIGEGRGGGRA